ncbi:MAG: large conductance mechanosensitive channel protein MscL [Phycicoccus sp.]|nr:large conductance mechanosensitive channel protein MscL [Phycicoccus sp.]
MKGFKEFLLQGNVVELAVAVVIAGAFGKVVEAMVTVIMDLIGKAGGTPDFSDWNPGGVSIGAFITAVVAFIVVAFAVYVLVVKPYQAAKARFGTAEEAAAADPNTELLKEIRDAIRAQG